MSTCDVAARIIDRHRGSLGAESNPGDTRFVTTRFITTLPLTVEPARS